LRADRGGMKRAAIIRKVHVARGALLTATVHGTEREPQKPREGMLKIAKRRASRHVVYT